VTDKQDFGVLHDKDIFFAAVHNRLWLPATNRKGVFGFVLEGLGGRSLLLLCLFPADVHFQKGLLLSSAPLQDQQWRQF